MKWIYLIYKFDRMGIKTFSQAFKSDGDISLAALKGATIAIDASVELYRCSLGTASTHTLTDRCGNPTNYISILFSNMIEYHKNNINQIWVFDHDPNMEENKEFHNPLKIQELMRRQAKKNKALEIIKNIKKKTEEEELFSDISDDEPDSNQSIEQQQKRCFGICDSMINNVKFMLNSFDIAWIDTPRGYEAEQICACLTKDEIGGMADHVLSSDSDNVMFGARSFVRKNRNVKTPKKRYTIYNLDSILTRNKITQTDLIKIGVILGCDFSKKTAGVGPKTVFKKYTDIQLTEEQKKSVTHFSRECPDINDLKWHNKIFENAPFQDTEKINYLLDWLEKEKNFNRTRLKNQIKKIIPKFESN